MRPRTIRRGRALEATRFVPVILAILLLAATPAGALAHAGVDRDGHAAGGEPLARGEVSPAITLGDPAYRPPSPLEMGNTWLLSLAIAAFVGATGLWWLVWRPALRQLGAREAAAGRQLAARIRRRLTLLAGGSLLLILATTGAGLLLAVARVAGASAAGREPAAIGDLLPDTPAGAIQLARLLLPAAAALALGPRFVAAARGPRGGRPPAGEGRDDPPEFAPPGLLGLALMAACQLAISASGHASAAPFWVPLAVVVDLAHQLALAAWAGGLGGLALTVPLVRRLPGASRALLRAVVARSSTVALAGAVVLAGTGLYDAWIHGGSLHALASTAFGRLLGLELSLVLALAGSGAVVLRRLGVRLGATGKAARRGAASDERAGQALSRTCGRIARLGAGIAALVLLACAVLSGLVPAREALAREGEARLARTIVVDDLSITVTLATLRPGENTFEVRLRDARDARPVADVERVALRFAHNELDIGESEAIAEPRGDGRYVAAGPYLSFAGNWELGAVVRRGGLGDARARFVVPIGAAGDSPGTAGRVAPPNLGALASSRGLGALLLLAGAGCLAGGLRLFRRGSGWGTALLMLVPTSLVVGGYLLANGGASGPAHARRQELPNPVVADAASHERGRAVFESNCVACHGPQGRGDGPQADRLAPRPPDMALPHTAEHSDSYLFNTITDGSPGSAMFAWGPALPERERWDLVNFLRTLNPLTDNTSPAVSAAAGQAAPVPIVPATGAAPADAPVPAWSPAAAAATPAASPRAGSPTAPPPAWPPLPSSGPNRLAQRRAVGELVAELRIKPRIFAPTVVEVRLADRDGDAPPDIARVDVQFAMADMAHGASGIVASPLGGGRYGAEATLLTMEGAWVMGLRVERAGARVDSALFHFEVGPDAPDGAVEAYHTRPTEPLHIADIQVLYDVVVPNRVAVVAGRPVRLEVIFAGRPGCGEGILIPEAGIAAPVSADGLGEVTFVPGRSGRLGFECGADGLRARFIDGAAGVVAAAEHRDRVARRPRAARRRSNARAEPRVGPERV